jgi:hypothetical protein
MPVSQDGAPAARGPAVVWRDIGQPKSHGRFVQMNAGTISPAQFFSPENVGAIRAAAGPVAAPPITSR